jgi:hypothetical protein
MAQTKSIKDLKSEFSKLIQEVDAAIKPLIDSINIQTISGHNAGYRRYAADKFFKVPYSIGNHGAIHIGEGGGLINEVHTAGFLL